MKFEEFKNQLKNTCITKQTFFTLKQNKEFTAVYKPSRIEVIPVSTNNERPIPIHDFQRIWNVAKTIPKEKQFDPINYQQITVNASYILTLIKQIIKDSPLE